MTTAIAVFVAAVVLALASLGLFVLALRQLVTRQTEIVAEMLARYDDRLAEFAQTLNDALVAPRAAAPCPSRRRDAPSGSSPRTITAPCCGRSSSRAQQTSTEAAIAVVTNGRGTPTFATVGFPRPRRRTSAGWASLTTAALARSRSRSVVRPPRRPAAARCRAGSSCLSSPSPRRRHSSPCSAARPERRFSEGDIEALEGVVVDARPALERTLALREPDPVPELDPLTQLYDRSSFNALLDREIHRARAAGQPLAFLVVDVDRLTTLNARIGHLAADAVLAEVADRLRTVAGRRDYPCRVGGGRYAVLLPGSSAQEGEKLFDTLRAALHERPIGEAGIVSVSGGVAELLQGDDTAELLGRVDAALGLAKGAGRGTVVTTALR